MGHFQEKLKFLSHLLMFYAAGVPFTNLQGVSPHNKCLLLLCPPFYTIGCTASSLRLHLYYTIYSGLFVVMQCSECHGHVADQLGSTGETVPHH